MSPITVRLQWFEEHTTNDFAIEFKFDGPYRRAFEPLNRNRELLFDVRAQHDAAEQQEFRKQVCSLVSQKFDELLRYRDTINGYPPASP